MSRLNEPPHADRGAAQPGADLALVDAGQRSGKAFLMTASGEAAGTVFPLTLPALTIGRSPAAEVRVNEQAVSNEHARLHGSGGRYSIVDLGSTNGTYVNGQRIETSVMLEGGDTIRTGSTTFTFVTRDTGSAPATLKINGDGASPNATRVLVPAPKARQDRVRPRQLPAREDEDGEDSVSLTDVVRTVKTYWVYAKRYGWLAITCTFFGIALGVAQARLNPPPGSAWFEMTLVTDARGGEEDAVKTPFVAPESTFKSLPLIKKTLRELHAPDTSDRVASEVQSSMSFEQTGFNTKVWRGDYQDATAEQAVLFLSKHVEVYVDSEIDKILKVLRADAEFDREQEEQAAERVARARDLLLLFMNEHPEAVPKDAKMPEGPKTPRVPAGASAAQLDTAIVSTEQALSTALRAIQSKKAGTYIEQAAQAESKIAEARSRGLADQHPEIKNLTALASTMRAKAQQILAGEPTPSEQALDPEVQRLRKELADLRAKRAAAPGPPPGASPQAAPKPALPQNLAQLKLQYAELARDYERAKTDHEALLKKRETTDRLLERERKSAEARYDIITPPTAEAASMSKTILKRAGFGGAVGLGLALIAAVCLELRRLLIARGHI